MPIRTGQTWGGWRFNSGANWVWSFVVAQDNGGGAGTILMDDYVNDTLGSEAAIANATGTQNYDGNTLLGSTSTATFADTLVLASSTTLDFLIDDYGLGDNAGGVALNISGPGINSSTPEPASIGMMARWGSAFALRFGADSSRSGIGRVWHASCYLVVSEGCMHPKTDACRPNRRRYESPGEDSRRSEEHGRGSARKRTARMGG